MKAMLLLFILYMEIQGKRQPNPQPGTSVVHLHEITNYPVIQFFIFCLVCSFYTPYCYLGDSYLDSTFCAHSFPPHEYLSNKVPPRLTESVFSNHVLLMLFSPLSLLFPWPIESFCVRTLRVHLALLNLSRNMEIRQHVQKPERYKWSRLDINSYG